MRLVKRLAGLTLAAAMTALAPATGALAQTSYANAPVKWVVPFAPGGVADATSRIVGEKLGEKLGQRVIIENIPGAGGINAARSVLNAPADGHTLALLTNGTSISVALFNKLPFDPVTQFEPVSAVGFFEFIFYTGANTPYKTLADVVKAARAKPGEITVGTIFAGSTQHLTMERF
ncbi:MAG: tripartite tricarboxylate transporter substrate binding protein, partial [Alphaproteobacteria bacterium]|nr:tripartite tricarboxylate transporter substrate binding protein [Alphaproteobacteria bacterium]